MAVSGLCFCLFEIYLCIQLSTNWVVDFFFARDGHNGLHLQPSTVAVWNIMQQNNTDVTF